MNYHKKTNLLFTDREATEYATTNIKQWLMKLPLSILTKYLGIKNLDNLENMLDTREASFVFLKLFYKRVEIFIKDLLEKKGRVYFICGEGGIEETREIDGITYYIYISKKEENVNE